MIRSLGSTFLFGGGLVLATSGSAHAACTITMPLPTGTVPTMAVGQTFTFVATDDCTTLSWVGQDGVVTKMPRRGVAVGATRHRYTVTLTSSEWELLLDPMYDTLSWRVTGRDAAGTVARVRAMNEIDVDRDGWTRTAGDTGECDASAEQNPGENEVCDNAIDDDCDGVVDECTFDEPVAVISTDEHDAMLGRVDCLSAGDVDGDGIDDLQIATWVNTSAGGNVYIVPGPASGAIDVADVVTISAPVGHVGYGVTAADVDADGIGDVLSGSYWAARYAYLFLGPVTADRVLADADAVLAGPESSTIDVDVLPDFDGDGAPDVAIGAEYVDDFSGAVYVQSGPVSGELSLQTSATYTFVGEDADVRLGTVDRSIGDATGDGIGDLAIGAPYAGVVHLVEGGATPGTYEAATVAWATMTQTEAVGQFGSSLAAGDYDGDGATDVVVGDVDARSSLGDNSGVVYAFFGPFSGAMSASAADVSWEATVDFIDLGAAAALSDVDADGALDVLMGAPSASGGAGAVYLQRGAATGTVDVATLPFFPGVESPDSFGWSIAPIADWTGDGGSEVAIGAPRVGDDATAYQGAVFVYESDRL